MMCGSLGVLSAFSTWYFQVTMGSLRCNPMVRQGRALCVWGGCILKLKFHLVIAAKTVKFKYAEGSPKTFPKTKSGGGGGSGGAGQEVISINCMI